MLRRGRKPSPEPTADQDAGTVSDKGEASYLILSAWLWIIKQDCASLPDRGEEDSEASARHQEVLQIEVS